MSDETVWSDLTLAEQAVAGGDFRHALHHLAPVLLEEPESPHALRLLFRVAAEASGDPLELLDLKDEVYAGTIVVAALLYARSGRSDPAIAHALQVVQAVPQARVLVWVQKWSRDLAFVRAMSMDAAANAILSFAFDSRDGDEVDERLTELLDAVENFRLHSPEHQRLAYAHSLILRRLGRFDEAVTAAAEVLADATDVEPVVGLATAYREAGRLEESLAVFERASRIDPDNEAVWLDVGDGHLDLQQYDQALHAYERVLALEPGQPWAVASIEYALFHLSNDAQHLDTLDDLAFAGNDRAQDLAAVASPYLGYLPPLAEATLPQPGQPSPEVAEHVAYLAAMPFHAYRWFEQARARALPASAIEDLLSCMVHPPETFAAAIVIAGSEPEAAWAESRRRRALQALIHGPIDGRTPAAIVAVTVAAAAGAADAREAAAWLQALWSRTAESDDWTVRAPLTFALLRFPGLDAATRAEVRQVRAALLAPGARKKGFWQRLFGR